MTAFLTPGQLKALEEAIDKAREASGIHRVPAADAEAYAYQLRDEIHWGVNGGPRDINLAGGSVPLTKPQ